MMYNLNDDMITFMMVLIILTILNIIDNSDNDNMILKMIIFIMIIEQ